MATVEAQKVSFLLSQSSIAPFYCMFCKSVLRGDTLSSDEIENWFDSDEFKNKVVAQEHKNDEDEDNAVQEIQEEEFEADMKQNELTDDDQVIGE
jgi:hypothetical protein